IRMTTAGHLALPGMPAERALACSVRLLDRGFFRVGGEAYARDNGTVGLATIRKEHVRFEGKEIVFEYLAKGGQERVQSVVDPEVHDAVRALKRRRGGGPELLAYNAAGAWRDVKSSDINNYIKDAGGGEYSAKDFRTWHATVLAAVALGVSFEASRTKTASKRAVSRAVSEVSHYLGNTPAVCRKSYIDPRVIDRYQSGVTIAGALGALGSENLEDEPVFRSAIEQAVIDLIEDRPSKLVEKAA
ncbi:MAG: DNA topoisomerase IB, partial [Actinomycetota bacterium]